MHGGVSVEGSRLNVECRETLGVPHSMLLALTEKLRAAKLPWVCAQLHDRVPSAVLGMARH